ncbi:hypothetical protein EYF80_031475 [Liparis tanakae]|uniref:Uncharacterized protein n=1 Tax=Liparis tanakae TaxID=230148 RepID=A0A4Z2H079_9TELE|nr:hypothetical protein EYF80_031475 [Liparis tanakae]
MTAVCRARFSTVRSGLIRRMISISTLRGSWLGASSSRSGHSSGGNCAEKVASCLVFSSPSSSSSSSSPTPVFGERVRLEGEPEGAAALFRVACRLLRRRLWGVRGRVRLPVVFGRPALQGVVVAGLLVSTVTVVVKKGIPASPAVVLAGLGVRSIAHSSRGGRGDGAGERGGALRLLMLLLLVLMLLLLLVAVSRAFVQVVPLGAGSDEARSDEVAHPAISDDEEERDDDDVVDPDFVLTAHDQDIPGPSDMGPSAQRKRRQPVVEVLQDIVPYLCVCKQADSDTDTGEGTGSSCCVCGFCSPSPRVSVGSFEAPQRLPVAAGAPIVQSSAMAAGACGCLSSSSSPGWVADG